MTFWKIPSIEELRDKQVDIAEREHLVHANLAAYHRYMESMYAERISRLRSNKIKTSYEAQGQGTQVRNTELSNQASSGAVSFPRGPGQGPTPVTGRDAKGSEQMGISGSKSAIFGGSD